MVEDTDKPSGLMTVDEFLSWAMARPDGARYELVAGEPVATAREPPFMPGARLRSGWPWQMPSAWQACPAKPLPTA
jgi:hypothetical protein